MRLLPLLLLALSACTPDPADTSGPDTEGPPDWVIGEVLDTEGRGVLATTPAPWGGDLWLLRVEGDHYTMGYQHGRLAGTRLLDLWWTYMGSLGEEMGLDDPEDVDVILGGLLDSAWAHFEANTPTSFLEEFQGMADGMAAAGVEYGDGDEDLVKIPTRLVTLIDLAMSSQLDVENIGGAARFIQEGYTDELLAWYGMERSPAPLAPVLEEAVRAIRTLDAKKGARLFGPAFQCSYFAAWGDRTDDGGLYMTRNMDFAADTGMYEYAMVTAYVPDGGVPHASISWLGASLGVLAGISQEGIAVSAVGASSPLERIRTEPAVLRAREALEHATSLESAIPYLENGVGDGLTRAPTIGYNALVSWGDPRGDGAAAEAVILENNGLSVGGYHHRPDCTVEPFLLRFAYDGSLESRWTPADEPRWVNAEGDAQEIDAEANVRLFAHDGAGTYVLDEHGRYVEDPVDGIPMQTGFPAECALYRGDEAMNYGVRIHQTAANGPADGGDGVMVQSSSWRKRYTPMREMAEAYAAGTSYEWEGETVIEDNGGVPVPIGLDEAEAISRVAAMSSNVWDVVYDTTDLVIRVSYESGTGDTWIPADEQPAFLELDLRDLFLTD